MPMEGVECVVACLHGCTLRPGLRVGMDPQDWVVVVGIEIARWSGRGLVELCMVNRIDY